MALRLIGYWRYPTVGAFAVDRGGLRGGPQISEAAQAALWETARLEQERWPDPRCFIDPSWNRQDRSRVVSHLLRGALLGRFRGLSICRFCGRYNGSAELTDGIYFWPEGLAHYLNEHELRLPPEFVKHALAFPKLLAEFADPEFDHLGQRLPGWAGGTAESVALLGLSVNPGEPSDAIAAERTDWSWVDRPSGWVEVDPTWWLQRERP